MKLLQSGIKVCALLIASILASGPFGLALVSIIQPQVKWQGAGSFVANFSYIQTLPYFFGFALVVFSIWLIAIIYHSASEEKRGLMLPSLVFAAIYAALVSFNYILQTTFIPALALKGGDGANILISALSMSNPNSLAWAIEMYGYMFLGLALLWLLPYFQVSGRSRLAGLNLWIRRLLIANAVLSIAGAIITSFKLDWVLTDAGLASFVSWNLIFLAIVFLIRLNWSRKLAAGKA